MLQIKMEASTRNYLVRLLENYKESLENSKTNKLDLMYELNQISIANARLMGKAPSIALGKNIEPINFGLRDDE